MIPTMWTVLGVVFDWDDEGVARALPPTLDVPATF